MKIEYEPIGIIHSPFTEPEGTPKQPKGSGGVAGTVEVFPQYAAGLKDLDGFSHIVLLSHFHRSVGFELRVVPFRDVVLRGLFATRAPRRPNPIGLSVVRLRSVEGTTLHVEDLDIVDGTPLLDIKPYLPDVDPKTPIRTGWLERVDKAAGDEKAERHSAPEP